MNDTRKTVIVVDDDLAILKSIKNSLVETYNVFTAPSAKKMFDLIACNKPELILMDNVMPEMNGEAALRELKANPATQDIPVIFLTGRNDSESELNCLTLGAIDYISKPCPPELLRKRLEIHMTMQEQCVRMEEQNRLLDDQRQELLDFNINLQRLVWEHSEKVLELQHSILTAMANLVENRDSVTGRHVERTQHGLEIMLNALKDVGLYRDQIDEWNFTQMLWSAQLHDLGKIAISDSILCKPGKLTAEEFDVIKDHTVLGMRIIDGISQNTSENEFFDHARIFAGAHHEWWNGKGYPNGLSGEDIPLQGRLMAIVDVYDALTSARPYKEAISHEEAVDVILSERGTHFEPVLVDLFTAVSGQFPLTPEPKGNFMR